MTELDQGSAGVPVTGSRLFSKPWRSQKRHIAIIFILVFLTALLIALSFLSPSLPSVEHNLKPSSFAHSKRLAALLLQNCSCSSEENGRQPKHSPEVEIVERIVEKPVERVVEKIIDKIVERMVYETEPVRIFVYDLPSKFTTDFYAHPHATVSTAPVWTGLRHVLNVLCFGSMKRLFLYISQNFTAVARQFRHSICPDLLP